MASRRTSAAYRIAFANFGAVTIALGLLGLVVFWAMHIAFTRQLDASIADEAQTLAVEYHHDGRPEFVNAIAEREASRSPNRLLYAVYARDGRRLYGTLRAARPPAGWHDLAFIGPNGGRDTARGLATDLSPNERLLVAADREWIEQIDRTLVTVFAFAFVGACLLGLFGALTLGAYLRRRMRAIGSAAEAIIGGDIRGRMPISRRDDEFDQLAATLNRMLDRIEGLLESLRQVSSDVAHDLRTPLARLRNRLEQGLVEGDAAASRAVVEDALRRVDEVLSLFAAILRIAEVESAEPRRFFTRVDVSVLATELAESYAPAITDNGRELMWSIAPGLVVDGDRELLAQAVINLLENAQHHTPIATPIRLTVNSTEGLIHIQVSDTGPGVPEADRSRIVRRFTRLETSRNTAGHGLGLSLVAAVARLHGGRLFLGDNAPGLVATIEFPLACPPA